jgi:hypothetical protein
MTRSLYQFISNINPKIKIRFTLLDKDWTSLLILHYEYQSKLSKIVIYK